MPVRLFGGVVPRVHDGVSSDPEERSPFAQHLVALQSGDEAAWVELINELYTPLLAFLRLRGAHEPEDLLSEVLLNTARDIGRFQGGEIPFRAWIFKIAQRRVVDEYRYRSRRPSQVLDPADLREYPASGGDVETEALASLGTDRIMTLFQRLTDSQTAMSSF